MQLQNNHGIVFPHKQCTEKKQKAWCSFGQSEEFSLKKTHRRLFFSRPDDWDGVFMVLTARVQTFTKNAVTSHRSSDHHTSFLCVQGWTWKSHSGSTEALNGSGSKHLWHVLVRYDASRTVSSSRTGSLLGPRIRTNRGRQLLVPPQLWNQLAETQIKSNIFNLLFNSGIISSIYPDIGSLHFLFMSILFCFNINVSISCFHPSPRSTLPFSKVLHK